MQYIHMSDVICHMSNRMQYILDLIGSFLMLLIHQFSLAHISCKLVKSKYQIRFRFNFFENNISQVVLCTYSCFASHWEAHNIQSSPFQGCLDEWFQVAQSSPHLVSPSSLEFIIYCRDPLRYQGLQNGCCLILKSSTKNKIRLSREV